MSRTQEQEAILAAGGNLVVVGRPGSGKTTVALWKALARLTRGDLAEHQDVLFLSFSNAAVERIAEASQLELPRHLRGRLRMATYHSFCREILAAHPILLGLRPPFQILMPRDARIVRNERGQDAGLELERLERAESRVHFDRFAALTAALLRRYPRLRAAYGQAFPMILVDEYQDTDDEQAALVQLLGESSQVICLGDPEQRIYDFGERVVRSDRLATLSTTHGYQLIDLGNSNHRNSGNGIREYAQAILRGQSNGRGPATVFRCPPNEKALVDRIMRAVGMFRGRAQQEGWGRSYGPSICIMLPSNKLVHMVSRCLRSLPEEERRRFRHEVIVDREPLSLAWDMVLGVLEAASAGDEAGTVKAVLQAAGRYFKFLGKPVNFRRAAQLQQWSEAIASGGTPSNGWLASLRTATSRPRSWTGMAEEDTQTAATILREVTGDTYLNGAMELLDLRPPNGDSRLMSALQARRLASGSYGGACELGRQRLVAESLLNSDGRRGRLCLMTLHRCKGGEYDAVVLAEASYPGGRFTNPDGREGAAANYPKSRMLLNVAITRARQAIAIVTPVSDPSPLL